MSSGLYDPWVTPAGRFRKWQSTGSIECMSNGAWHSIPEAAQAEIKRLTDRLEACAVLVAAERSRCFKIADGAGAWCRSFGAEETAAMIAKAISDGGKEPA